MLQEAVDNNIYLWQKLTSQALPSRINVNEAKLLLSLTFL